MTRNKRHIRHPQREVRKMFPTVAETLGEVCSTVCTSCTVVSPDTSYERIKDFKCPEIVLTEDNGIKIEIQ
jgi:hypothetical protein